VNALERLVEVWAEGPGGIGRCGSGWVVGWRGVFTARHVVDPFLTADPVAGGPPDTDARITRGVCLVRRGGATGFGDWVNSEVLWLHPTLDVALLKVTPGEGQRWEPPKDRSPRLAGLGERALTGETVGFPDAEQKPSGERDSEHAMGRLLPLGGLRDPEALVPFDVDAAVPDDAALWQGISGSGVRDEYGRLIAVVVKAHPDRQQRRLFVVPVGHLARDPAFARAAGDLGLDPVVEHRFAPVWRRNVDCRGLTEEGVPAAAGDVADPGVFGVHTAVADDTRGGSLPVYLPRQRDADFDMACDEAVTGGRRLVLVVGDSAAGKSRSAAEAAHRHPTLGARRLVVPILDGGLSRLLDAVSLDGTLVWLDDLDKHVARGLDTATFRRLLDHYDAVVVATIRASELQARGGDLSDPVWELLNEAGRVRRIELDAALRDTELAEAHERFSDRGLLDALDHGIGLGEWLLAGPRLEEKLLGGKGPRRALLDTVVAWYRTGLKQPLPEAELRRLWVASLDSDLRQLLERRTASDQEHLFRDACAWACEPLIARPLHEQALVTEERDGYVANDYVVDRVVKRSDRPPVPAPVWRLATDIARQSFIAGNGVRLWNVGVAAYGENAPDHAITAMGALASAGDPNAMFNLGVVLQQRGDPEALVEAETWWRRAAQHDQPNAMLNLGLLLQQRGDPDALVEAETWYRRAAQHDQPSALFNLGALLQQRGDPEALVEAESWYRRAAQYDDPDAMVGLGLLLEDRGDPKALAQAEFWYRRAAKHDDADAMVALGLLLEDRGDPEALAEAEIWWRRAAQHNDPDAMVNLGLLLKQRGRPEALAEAETWWRRAAEHDHPDAMVNLGLLLGGRGGPEALAEADTWWRRAAQHDHPEAMVGLGLLLEDRGGPEALAEAETWYRRAAQHDDPDAMFKLGVLLRQRGAPEALAEAETWWRRAAKHDHPDAMVGLGLLLGGWGGPEALAEANAWYRRAAKHDQPEHRRRGRRAGLTLALVGTAAAAVLAFVLVVAPSRDSESVEFALTPTELVPGARGTAKVTPEESGLRIELNATRLPRRDNGLFYQAWLRNDAGQAIPIGTFHDGNDVVLWAGVSLEDYPTLTITEETADNEQASSGRGVLVGTARSP
jgi:TPR repeat protein